MGRKGIIFHILIGMLTFLLFLSSLACLGLYVAGGPLGWPDGQETLLLRGTIALGLLSGIQGALSILINLGLLVYRRKVRHILGAAFFGFTGFLGLCTASGAMFILLAAGEKAG